MRFTIRQSEFEEVLQGARITLACLRELYAKSGEGKGTATDYAARAVMEAAVTAAASIVEKWERAAERYKDASASTLIVMTSDHD